MRDISNRFKLARKMDLIESDHDDLLPDFANWEITDLKHNYKLPEDYEDFEKLSVQSFKWTDTEYTPRQLLDNFHQNMPFIIMTTVGYLGRDEGINAVSSDEMYWVKGIIKVPRVIVANTFDAYFSIPITCKFPVIALMNGARGRLRGLTAACWTTDHYHPCSNLGEGISEGCFIFDFASLPLEVARSI